MRHPLLRSRSALLVLGAAALLVGCSDDDPNDADSTDVVEDSGTDGSEDAAADADTTPNADTNADTNTDTGADTNADAGTDPDAWTPPGDLSLPPALVPGEGEFMVVVLPDTQIYAQSFPETFDSQLRWVADYADEYRIVFVSHVGDIVQTTGHQNEWDVATAAYEWIRDIDMPHGFSMGGHDTSWGIDGEYDSSCSPFARTDCDSTAYRAHFGPQHTTTPSGTAARRRGRSATTN